MAKIYGLFGAITGKLADTVMAVRNGEQLARKYQPVVFNPSTPAQVAQRAKMKLLSQLSAVLGKEIAIPREGAVSARNLFTKVNFPLVTYSENTADIDLNLVQITKSSVGFRSLEVSRTENGIVASLTLYQGILDVDRVVYIAMAKGNDNKLRYIGQAVATSAGDQLNWQATLPTSNEEVVVLGYGVRDNTENARATFGNLTAVTAENIAKLIVNRTLTESDVTTTETRGATLAAV